MNWSSLAEFTHMGGYAMYVWGAFLMALAALVWECVLLVQRRRRALDEVRRQHLDEAVSHSNAS